MGRDAGVKQCAVWKGRGILGGGETELTSMPNTGDESIPHFKGGQDGEAGRGSRVFAEGSFFTEESNWRNDV